MPDAGAAMALFGAPGSQTRTYLVRKMGEFAVSNTAFHTLLYITDLHLPEAELAPWERADRRLRRAGGGGRRQPRHGVLLTHEQGWLQY